MQNSSTLESINKNGCTDMIPERKLIQARLPFKTLPTMKSTIDNDEKHNMQDIPVELNNVGYQKHKNSNEEHDKNKSDEFNSLLVVDVNKCKGNLIVNKKWQLNINDKVIHKDINDDLILHDYKNENDAIIEDKQKLIDKKRVFGISSIVSHKLDVEKQNGAGTIKGGNSDGKIRIKLQFTDSSKQKNKKRKSFHQFKSEINDKITLKISESSDDLEIISDELNPQKRQKRDDNILMEPQNDNKQLKEMSFHKTPISDSENHKIVISSDDNSDTEILKFSESSQMLTSNLNRLQNISKLNSNYPMYKNKPNFIKLSKNKNEMREERELMKKREREAKEENRRKDREAKDEKRRKEREEKERKRLAEIEMKNEEKRKKNEAKEEDQRKKEEERKRREQEKKEAEIKKRKVVESFKKWFRSPENEQDINAKALPTNEELNVIETLAFRPFQIKGDMILAPIRRRTLTDKFRERLDTRLYNNVTENNIGSDLYLVQLKSGEIKPLRWQKLSTDTKEDNTDIQLVEDELERVSEAIVEEYSVPVQRMRVKFFKFHENRRPPYFGTWRKRTNIITPRRPFALDKQYLDYEVDSDDEWEEEEPGESLDGSDDEKEKESDDDDYEVDNEWFVPHGHLSDEEMQNQDEYSQNDMNNREAQKAKLKVLQHEFAQEMKKKTEKIRPRLIGCIWVDENGNQPQFCPKIIWDALNISGAIFAHPPVLEDSEIFNKNYQLIKSPTSQICFTGTTEKVSDKIKPISLTEDLLKDLIRLVHGNSHSKVFLIKEFIAFVEGKLDVIKNGYARGPLKSAVREKIEEFAEWTIVELNNTTNDAMENKKKKKIKKRLCWIISKEILEAMHMHDKVSLTNAWQYILPPKEKHIKVSASLEESCVTYETKNHKEIGNKSKKKLSETTGCKTNLVVKKRLPLLMSPARGQQFEQPRNALFRQFLKNNIPNTLSNSRNSNEVIYLE